MIILAIFFKDKHLLRVRLALVGGIAGKTLYMQTKIKLILTRFI